MRMIETLIDEQVRKAREEGAFDDLASTGRPLTSLDRTRSAADVWLENKVREEGLELPLPDALQLRKDALAELAALRGVASADEVRRRLHVLNARIRKANATHVKGPGTRLAPIDVDRFLSER